MSVISKVAIKNFRAVEIVIHLTAKQRELLPRNIQMVPVSEGNPEIENLGVQGFVSLRNLTPTLVISGLKLSRLVYERESRKVRSYGHKVVITYTQETEPVLVSKETASDMMDLLQCTWDSLKLYKVGVDPSSVVRVDVSGSKSDDEPGLGELRCDGGLMYLRWRSRQLFEGYGPSPRRPESLGVVA